MDSLPPPTPSGSSIPVANNEWPRRTAKACSNCRRDKVRCDGARPCSGCARKNLQCLDGCDACRRVRARCEKTGDRCTRCVAEKIECTEEASMIPFVHGASPPAPPESSERVKSACQSCRNDNKKCDNQRPCSRCVARSETCVPFMRAPKQARLRCERCRKHNVRCEDARPCQNCITAGSECVNLARQGRGCGTRVKVACISCRRNKIRCDGHRPCGPCDRRGWDCMEQACKRCTQEGSDKCPLHRRNLGNEISPAQSTSTTDPASLPSPLPPSNQTHYPMPWLNSDPSMFAPTRQGAAPDSGPGSNSLPKTTSPADSKRD